MCNALLKIYLFLLNTAHSSELIKSETNYSACFIIHVVL